MKRIVSTFVVLSILIPTISFGAMVPGSVVFANPNGKNTGSDSTQFFWNNVANRLGIGTNLPLEPLHILGDVLRLDNTAGLSTLSLNRANGTIASPSTLLAFQELSSVDFGGYDGTAYAPGARIRALTREAWTGGAKGTDLGFFVTPSSTTIPVEKMTLKGTGALALGGANLDNYNIHAEENARIEIVGTGYGASKTVVAARLANGTMAAPTHVNVGQIMGEFAIGGYKDSAFTTSASAYMLGTATETFSDFATGTKLEFGVTQNGTTGTMTEMVLDHNGYLGVGDTSPEVALDIETTGAVDVASFTNGNGVCSINPAVAGGIICTSDANMKKNIEGIENENSLNIVNSLRPVKYNWKNDADGTDQTSGFVAQEVEEVLPELVVTEKGTKRLSMNGLIPYIVGSVKELSGKVDGIFTKGLSTPKVETEMLCIGETCLTEAELIKLKILLES